MTGIRSSFQELNEITEKAQTAYYLDKVKRLDGANTGTVNAATDDFDAIELRPHTALRYLLLAEGQDTQNWYTSLETVSSTFGVSPIWLRLFSGAFSIHAISGEDGMEQWFETSSRKLGDAQYRYMDFKTSQLQNPPVRPSRKKAWRRFPPARRKRSMSPP